MRNSTIIIILLSGSLMLLTVLADGVMSAFGHGFLPWYMSVGLTAAGFSCLWYLDDYFADDHEKK